MPELLPKITFILDELTLIIAIIVSWIYRKNRELTPIRLYMLGGLIHFAAVLFLSKDEAGKTHFNEMFNFFSMMDLSLLYFYFWKLIAGRSKRFALLICYLIIVGICLYYWLGPPHSFQKFTSTLYGLENLFITVPCILYFYEMFTTDDETDLKTNPHFFVTCGILFFYGTTFPFYISFRTLIDITPGILNVFVSINGFLSTILSITLIKAFLCPYQEQK